MIGMKDLGKLAAITVVTLCAAFVCTIFLNYKMDLPAIREAITAYQEIVFYEAQMGTAKVVVGVSGGCLIVTTVILLVFYIKNYIDTHGKELGILKALGYSRLHIAKSFWVFGFSVLAGAGIGFVAAWLYLPTFYRVMNEERILPDLEPQFHGNLVLFLVVLPTLFFMLLAVFYAFLKLNGPVLDLLKERKHSKVKHFTKDKEEDSFLSGLRKSTLYSRKILVFFVGFSAFCFSAMTQMSMAMDDLASEQMAWIMLSIGLILAFMTLLMSLTSVLNANTQTIAMMKVFGYSKTECSRSVFGGYRPVSYVGFLIGTLYQYVLLRIMVDVIFADWETMPEFHFDWRAMLVSLVTFLLAYELILYVYSRKIEQQSVKSIMLE